LEVFGVLKKIWVIALLTMSTPYAIAQNNNVFVELGGNGLLYTINYDRAGWHTELGGIAAKVSVRAGWGPFAFYSTDGLGNSGKAIVHFVPVLANLLLGGDHKLEIGGGVTFVTADGTINFAGRSLDGLESGSVQTFLLGYRYHKKDAPGLLLRVSITPLRIPTSITSNGTFSGPFFPWGGVSLGYSF